MNRSNQNLSARWLRSPICAESLEARRMLFTDWDVTDYGAIPDDLVDDTAAINACIHEPMAQAGDRIVFPAGVYKLRPADNTPVFELVPNRTYLGQGATLSRPSTFTYQNGQTFHAQARSGTPEPLNIRIEGLTFDGAGVKVEQENVNWADNVDIMNCTFKNAGPGAGLDSVIYVSSGARNCEITNNLFHNTDSTFAISAHHAESFRILDNTFNMVRQPVQLVNGREARTGVEVSRNRIIGAIEESIEIFEGGAGDVAFEGLRVENNVISDFRLDPNRPGLYHLGSYGISVVPDNARNTVIRGNKLFGKLVDVFQDYRIPAIGIEVAMIGGTVQPQPDRGLRGADFGVGVRWHSNQRRQSDPWRVPSESDPH